MKNKGISLIITLFMFLSVLQFGTISTVAETLVSDTEISTNYGDFANKINNEMVLFIGWELSFIKGEAKYIDDLNDNVVPFIKDERTLVPVRFISESLNAKVDWNDETETVTISYDDKEVELTIGSNVIIVNGNESYLDVPAQIIEERTFIPLRALVEALNKKVFWDDRGLIVISDKDNLINLTFEQEYLNTYITNIKEVQKQSKLNVIKTNEQIIERVAETYYVINGVYPTQTDIENNMNKSLESLQLIIIHDGNGKYKIINTDLSINVEDYNFELY